MWLRIWRREKHVVVVTAVVLTSLIFFWRRWSKNLATADVASPQPRKAAPETFATGHRLCLLVPFRDRFDELAEFVPSISKFLEGQGVSHALYLINQVDGYRFNRASLINAGFLESSRDGDAACDYLAMHDVDLIPLNQKIRYDQFPDKGPLHLAAPGLHPRYDYPDFIGGILMLSSAHFTDLNGMSNRYWGWGLEDDEFRARLRDAKLPISRPDVKAVGTGRAGTFAHNHLGRKRNRDHTKCHNQVEETRTRDRKTGLLDLKYTLVSRKLLTFDGHAITLLNIKLDCDKIKTPWCDCSGVEPDKPKKMKRIKDSIMPILPPRN